MLIKDFAFVPKYPDGLIEQAKIWLIRNKRAFDKVANYCLFFSLDKKQEYIEQFCHAGLSDTSKATGASLVATETAITRFPELENFANDFLSWFLYRSFASPFILNKKDYTFCRNYGIVVSTDIPQPIFQAIMIISRHFAECRVETFTMFNSLVARGICEELAYSACFNTWYSTREELGPHVVTRENHRAWGLFSFNALVRFINGDFGNLLVNPKGYFRDKPDVYGVTGIFREPNASDISTEALIDEDFLALRKEYNREKESLNYSPPNPFGKASAPNQSLTYDEFFEVLIPYINRKVKAHVGH